jgi:hypothetical protein
MVNIDRIEYRIGSRPFFPDDETIPIMIIDWENIFGGVF